MNGARWIGFVLVWLALVIFTLDAIRARRRKVVAEPVPI
jgi:chloramphenicol-sensitive protein RarD